MSRARAINYVAKAAVVATTKGQGGKERDDLAGLTVPVKLSGPLDGMKYEVDYSRGRGRPRQIEGRRPGEGGDREEPRQGRGQGARPPQGAARPLTAFHKAGPAPQDFPERARPGLPVGCGDAEYPAIFANHRPRGAGGGRGHAVATLPRPGDRFVAAKRDRRQRRLYQEFRQRNLAQARELRAPTRARSRAPVLPRVTRSRQSRQSCGRSSMASTW